MGRTHGLLLLLSAQCSICAALAGSRACAPRRAAEPRCALSAKSRRQLERQLFTAGSKGQWQRAVALLDEIRAAGVTPGTKAVNGAASAFARAGLAAKAIALLRALQASGGGWDAYSYTTAISQHGKLGEWEAALALVREQRDAALAGEGEPPNEFVYGAAIGAAAASARWREALELLGAMEEAGVPPNIRCYNGALSACDRGLQPMEAIALLDRMRLAGVRPDQVAYTTAISACARRRPALYGLAVGLAEQMEYECIPKNAYTYGALAQAHAAVGAWKEAFTLLGSLRRYDVARPNEARCHATVAILGAVTDACADGGQWREALLLIRGMERMYDVVPDAACVNSAIAACARGRQWREALRLLDGMGTEATAISYGAALSAAAKGAQWELGLALLDRMRAAGLPPTVPCYTAAIAACGAGGQSGRAVELWREIVERGLAADAVCVNAALGACEAAARWGDGFAIVEEIHRIGLARGDDAAGEAAGAGRVGGGGVAVVNGDVVSVGSGPGAVGPHALHAQTNRVCVLLDSLRRRGLGPADMPSFEAAVHACELGVGERLEALLQGLHLEAERDGEAGRGRGAARADDAPGAGSAS